MLTLSRKDTHYIYILYKYIRSRVTACNVPRATKYSSGCKASACQAGYRVRNGKCAGAINPVREVLRALTVELSRHMVVATAIRSSQVHVCCVCRLQRASRHEVLVRVQGFGVPCWLQGGERHLSRYDLSKACKAILRLSLPRIYCTVTFHNTFWLFIHTMACALQEKPPPCFPHAHFPY